MRPQSQLVSFAKSLRMEGEGGSQATDPSKQQQQDDAQKIVDHFKDIDLDELPDNIRTAVTNAKATIIQLSTTVQTAEQRRGQAENFARQKQSEADKLRGVLQHHKLTDAPPSGDKPNLEGDKIAARAARLVEKHGLKPEAAKVYATMLEDEARETRDSIMRELSPLAGAVGNVQAGQLLQAAEVEHSHLFAIPEIAQAVRDNVKVMVQQGNTVNANSITHLVEMAVGSYTLRNPGKLDKLKVNTEIPNFKGGGGMNTGGGHRSNVDTKTDGRPTATQPETMKIIDAINAHMIKDLPKKGTK